MSASRCTGPAKCPPFHLKSANFRQPICSHGIPSAPPSNFAMNNIKFHSKRECDNRQSSSPIEKILEYLLFNKQE